MKAFVSLPKNSQFKHFFPEENIKLTESLGNIRWNPLSRNLTPEEVAADIGDAEVYVTGWGSPALDRTILDAAPNLRLLAHLCGSVSPFVSDALWERGIRVICGNDFFAESVAEGTIGYMLSALRDIPKYSHALKTEGKWKTSRDYTRSLLGKTVGIISYGAIARHLVRMLQPFRVRIKVYDIVPLPESDVLRYNLTPASMEEIFSTSDIITVHTPLYDKTYHMIGEELFRLIPNDAILINTSRGAILDEAALARELGHGRFRAMLDVYEKEPLPENNPLLQQENVLLMPHMGGPTTDLLKSITRTILLEAAAFIDHGDDLPHEVSKERASTMTVNPSQLQKKA